MTVPHEDAPGGLSHIVGCRQCGLRRLDPRPGPASIARYYDADSMAYAGRRRSPMKQRAWDWLRDASSGRAAALTWLPGIPWVAHRVAGYVFDINLDLPPPGGEPLRVLDVGCGFGDLLLWLQSRGCVVQGVDFDERAAARARRYGVPVRVGSLLSLGLTSGSYDAAVLSHSLEHVPDPVAQVREVGRLLRPGGALHVAVPNGDAAGLSVEGAAWGALCHPVHFWYFGNVQLEMLLRRCGFDGVRVGSVTIWRDHLRQWSMVAQRRGRVAAFGEVAAFARRRLSTRLTGDVLRMVATRAAS